MSQQVLQNVSFAQYIFEQVAPENSFLEEMNKSVPWEIIETFLNKEIVYKTGGRPPYPVLLVYKMHLLQTWYGLSDAGLEFQVKDRLSFRQFLGLGITDRVPDATTVETLRHKLAENTLGERLVALMDKYFVDKGLILKEGNIVDATFIQANSRPHKNPDKNSDLDADHGHKGFGYTATANVDKKSKLIRKSHTTSARPHDSQMLPDAMVGDEKVLYADSAYEGHRHKIKGVKTHIIYKRHRGKKGEPAPLLSPRKTALNKACSKIRSRGEHVFAAWKAGVGAIQRAWYRGLERVNQQVQSLTMAYNLRRYGFLTRAKSA